MFWSGLGRLSRFDMEVVMVWSGRPAFLASIAIVIGGFVYLNVKNDLKGYEKPPSTANSASIRQCEEMIKARATYPLSVNFHRITGTASDMNGVGGKPRIAMRFDAKNALGNELPYMANCDFGTDPPTLIISR